jgi:hypothetical protein
VNDPEKDGKTKPSSRNRSRGLMLDVEEEEDGNT